jgi:hypothetical protein
MSAPYSSLHAADTCRGAFSPVISLFLSYSLSRERLFDLKNLYSN